MIICQHTVQSNVLIPNVLEAFRKINSKEYLNDIFYLNLASFIDIDKYETNVFWSQKNIIRNFHIYQNIIQDIIAKKPKRVMILFGAAHIKTLQNYLVAHPVIKIVDSQKYLR